MPLDVPTVVNGYGHRTGNLCAQVGNFVLMEHPPSGIRVQNRARCRAPQCRIVHDDVQRCADSCTRMGAVASLGHCIVLMQQGNAVQNRAG